MCLLSINKDSQSCTQKFTFTAVHVKTTNNNNLTNFQFKKMKNNYIKLKQRNKAVRNWQTGGENRIQYNKKSTILL